MIYCIDIDGTICRTLGADYQAAKPLSSRIAQINALFDRGHEIVYFTARGSVTGIDHTELTRAQLARWGARYSRLEMGKPAADVYIDDRGLRDDDFFGDDLGPQHAQL